jgi:hypothetical protein
MWDGAGALGAGFGTVGLLFAMVGVGLGVFLIRSMVSRKRILATGLTAEAVCLDTYTRSRGENGSSRHAILNFTSHDGRVVRFDTVILTPMVTGDFVTVRYPPERPEKAVLVHTGVSRAANGVGMVLGLVFCGVFTLGGLFFAIAGFGFFELLSGSPDPSVYVPDPTFTP